MLNDLYYCDSFFMDPNVNTAAGGEDGAEVARQLREEQEKARQDARRTREAAERARTVQDDATPVGDEVVAGVTPLKKDKVDEFFTLGVEELNEIRLAERMSIRVSEDSGFIF